MSNNEQPNTLDTSSDEDESEELKDQAQLFFTTLDKWYRKNKTKITKSALQTLDIQKLILSNYPYKSLEQQISLREKKNTEFLPKLAKLSLQSKAVILTGDKQKVEKQKEKAASKTAYIKLLLIAAKHILQ